MATWHRRLGREALVGVLALAGACGGPVELGARDGGARDGGGPPAPARADECGNGLDDDANGRIDDGCPCGIGETQACFTGAVASRGRGACRDGVQTCAPSGAEWGDWGDAPCTGATGPAAEQCDGLDHDCDGARDEGCPCTAGETRECGLEFATGPCRGGAQRCGADGAWSGCDGAVLPEPDTCDGVDNDCDGTADEGCGCVPVPEVCRDGMDNDCDGAIDEVACDPDWPPDAGTELDGGVPADGGSGDAGPPTDACVPTLEQCDNGVDDDCDGAADEACAGGCAASTVPADVEYVVDRSTDALLEFVVGGDDTPDTLTMCDVTTDPGEIDYTIAFRIAEAGRYEFADLEGVAHLGVWYVCDTAAGCSGSTGGGDGSFAGGVRTSTAARAGDRHAYRIEGHTASRFRLRVRYLGP